MKELYEAMVMLEKNGMMVDTIKVTRELAKRLQNKKFDTFADIEDYGGHIRVKNEIGRIFGVKIIKEEIPDEEKNCETCKRNPKYWTEDPCFKCTRNNFRWDFWE